VPYFFLIPQLPSLSYGQIPPITSDSFRGLCRDYLQKGDLALLEYCSFGYAKPETTASPFINAWLARERTIATNLTFLRAGKLNRTLADFEIAHESFDAETQTKAAFAMENPLEAELFLDRGRWEAIENLLKTTYFGVNAVYAYMLKLLLIERRAAFNVEEGFAEYKALYAGILENAPKAGDNGEPQ
jgi:hypothetical protein